MTGLLNFLASPQEAQMVTDRFRVHDLELNFSMRSPDYLVAIPTESGVYFIAAQKPQGLLKVYVGKAKDLRRRIVDYHRTFQVHCPNDGKLAFFQDWLARADPGWKLFLYTLSVDAAAIQHAETLWINRLGPLVNATVRADESSKRAVQEAFRMYFDSFFSMRARSDG